MSNSKDSDAGKVFDRPPMERVNPYIIGGVLIMRRLKWDLTPLSWLSRKKIKNWKNAYKGKKALILCNGPSLNKVDFKMLQDSDVVTFGLNKINLLFEKIDFRPSVIVAVNPLVIEQNKAFFNSTEIPVFLCYKGKKWIRHKDNIHFLYSISQTRYFARDCSIAISQGATVTYVAMQLAFHMGFSNVGLVGCDHHFETKGPANKEVKGELKDPNHFDPNYFSSDVTWHLPDLTASELHYEIARDIFAHFNKKIVNCTEGGKLEIFDRMTLEAFLTGEQG